MITAQIESPFFLSEAEALGVIEANIDDIRSRLNAASGQNSNESALDAGILVPGVQPGTNPCPGSAQKGQPGDPDFKASCQCCECA